MLRGLLRAAPGCEALPVLREALVDGAVSDPHREHLRCRGYRLDPPYGPPPVTRAHRTGGARARPCGTRPGREPGGAGRP